MFMQHNTQYPRYGARCRVMGGAEENEGDFLVTVRDYHIVCNKGSEEKSGGGFHGPEQTTTCGFISRKARFFSCGVCILRVSTGFSFLGGFERTDDS